MNVEREFETILRISKNRDLFQGWDFIYLVMFKKLILETAILFALDLSFFLIVKTNNVPIF